LESLKAREGFSVTNHEDSEGNEMLVFRPYFGIRHNLGRQISQLYAPVALYNPGNFLGLISVSSLAEPMSNECA
jgi:hypothetical protein